MGDTQARTSPQARGQGTAHIKHRGSGFALYEYQYIDLKQHNWEL